MEKKIYVTGPEYPNNNEYSETLTAVFNQEYIRADLFPTWKGVANGDLPEEGHTVLINGSNLTWYYVPEEEAFYQCGSGYSMKKTEVTAWMYAPEYLGFLEGELEGEVTEVAMKKGEVTILSLISYLGQNIPQFWKLLRVGERGDQWVLTFGSCGKKNEITKLQKAVNFLMIACGMSSLVCLFAHLVKISLILLVITLIFLVIDTVIDKKREKELYGNWKS